jgi:transcription antitermination factor NusG
VPRSRKNDSRKNAGRPRRAAAKGAKARAPKAVPKATVAEERLDLRWLSIAAEEGSEPQVAKALGRLHSVVQVLLPMHDGAALYPGYVFAECCRGDDILDEICQVPGVEGVLARNGVFNYALGGHEPPTELEASALGSIRGGYARYTRKARGEMVAVARGQRITITRGVFSGMSGEVVSVNRREMSVIAKVRLSDGGMVRKVAVKHGQFEPLEGQEDDDWRL